MCNIWILDCTNQELIGDCIVIFYDSDCSRLLNCLQSLTTETDEQKFEVTLVNTFLKIAFLIISKSNLHDMLSVLSLVHSLKFKFSLFECAALNKSNLNAIFILFLLLQVH